MTCMQSKQADMKKIVIASNNKHKIEEIRAILGAHFDVLLSLDDIGINIEVVEDKDTFFGNALKKAKEISEATGLPALSDDSGLVVDALNGAPGVHSARFAGENASTAENNALLIEKMLGEKNRSAYFVSCVVIYFPDGSIVFAEGKTDGEILFEERGSAGFGYDPLFYSFELKKTFGEASAEEKNKVSHRGRALAELRKKLDC